MQSAIPYVMSKCNIKRGHGDIEICGMSRFKDERDVAVFVYLDTCFYANEKALQLCVYADRSSKLAMMISLQNTLYNDEVLSYNEIATHIIKT